MYGFSEIKHSEGVVQCLAHCDIQKMVAAVLTI